MAQNKENRTGDFKTSYNNATPYKTQILFSKESEKNVENKQFITTNDLNMISKISNRGVLGSSFKNSTFDPKKDQFGRIL